MARQDANKEFAATSFLYGANAPYLEDLHARYQRDPQSLDAEWRAFFEGLKDIPEEQNKPSWQRPGWPPVRSPAHLQGIGPLAPWQHVAPIDRGRSPRTVRHLAAKPINSDGGPQATRA